MKGEDDLTLLNSQAVILATDSPGKSILRQLETSAGPIWIAPGFARTRSLLRQYLRITRRNLKLLTVVLAYLTQAAVSMGQTSKTQSFVELPPPSNPVDFNTSIYYRNKLEFSLETGALPINIPFVFDVFVGGDYSHRPLHYTLVPIFPSLRWQMGNVRGPGILRGNTELSAAFSFTAIPRGPETRYGAFDLGVRRNFVHRNWRTSPYFEFRAGAGFINAKGPDGVPWAQGQDFTFTLMLGTGLRYNFNPRYSMTLAPTYMHVSNLYLSQPKYLDNGINVCGAMIGFNMRLGKPRQEYRQ